MEIPIFAFSPFPWSTLPCTTKFSLSTPLPRKQSSWGQHGAHLGHVGPRWAYVGTIDLAIRVFVMNIHTEIRKSLFGCAYYSTTCLEIAKIIGHDWKPSWTLIPLLQCQIFLPGKIYILRGKFVKL